MKTRKFFRMLTLYGPWILHTLRFNFHYFPFSQAVKLPILLVRPRFRHLDGAIQLDAPVRRGMVRIGVPKTTLFPKERTLLDLNGTLVFKGDCQISAGSVINTRKDSLLVFGHQVDISDRARIICSMQIEMGDYFNMSWESVLCDNDFHCLKSIADGKKRSATAPIRIGPYCWIGQQALVLKGTELPEHTVVQAGAVVTRQLHCAAYSIIGGNPARVLSERKYYRDFKDDKPIIPKPEDRQPS